MLDRIIRAANAIRDQRYAEAAIIFAAGSFVRGEGTAYSDLDLVVIYEHLPSAYRESFRFADFPVEAFVHDPETLHYFLLDVDRPSGIPALAQMVLEGIEVPRQNTLSHSLKELAASVIAMGPPTLSAEDWRRLRYSITDLVDDLRDPRSNDELIATGSQLYETLTNHYLRTNRLWSARGKSIPRVLKRANPDLCANFCQSFVVNTDPVFRLRVGKKGSSSVRPEPFASVRPEPFVSVCPERTLSLSKGESKDAQDRLRAAKSKAAVPARTALFDFAAHAATLRANGKRMHSRGGSVPMSCGSI